MAFSLSHYYGSAKSGLMNINPAEATQLFEDWMIAGGTGALLGLMSAATGGMDKKIFGLSVPMDGAASLVLGFTGLALRSPELKVASIAAAGSASARTFEGFFKKGMGAHGDFDANDIPFGFGSGNEPHQLPGGGWHQDQFSGQFSGMGFGFGNERDKLAEAAKLL